MHYIKGRPGDQANVRLAHLQPLGFSLFLKQSLREVEIIVEFSDHCYSEKYDPDKHGPLGRTARSDKGNERVFDEERYRLSLRLPELVRNLAGKRIVQTKNSTLVRINLSMEVEYAIFFTLKKAGVCECKMYVISAYPLDAGRKNSIVATGEMKFDVAVGLVMQGKKPKFPQRR